MNTPTQPWNYYSHAHKPCDACEGHGEVWNGRGLGGNDPDSWGIECEDCEGAGHFPCAVCGFDFEVVGYDCFVCNAVSDLPDALLLNSKFRPEFFEALDRAFDAAAKAAAQSERLAA